MTGSQRLTTPPWVRPYVHTGGRTHSAHQLLVQTQVMASSSYDPAFAARLLPEAKALYERVHQVTESVAELSAHCGVSLGVTRVLLGDLADGGRVQIISETTSPYDPEILERVLDGLRQLV